MWVGIPNSKLLIPNCLRFSIGIQVNSTRRYDFAVRQVFEAVRHPPGLDREAERDREGADRKPHRVVEQPGDAVDVGEDSPGAERTLDLLTQGEVGLPKAFFSAFFEFSKKYLALCLWIMSRTVPPTTNNTIRTT